MIRLTDEIWVGGWDADRHCSPLGITAVLNVAQDLNCSRGWPDLETMHVGLVDGPGNEPSAYAAAVLALAALLGRHRRVLVYCHGGFRSVAVVLMYLNARSERNWNDWWVILSERVDVALPCPGDVHREAFERLPWKALKKMLGG